MNAEWDTIDEVEDPDNAEDPVCIGCDETATEEKDGDLYCFECRWNDENFR